MRISFMAVIPGMWARGAEICTLNLLTALSRRDDYDIHFHAALRQALPADMELYLKPRFEQVAKVSYGIHADREGVNINLINALAPIKEAEDTGILLYAFDKSIPSYLPRTKSVLVVHGIAENDFAGYSPRFTDAVVCVSQYAADMAPEYGIPAEKVICIPNGVPEAVGTNRRIEWRVPVNAWTWCFVGGLNKLKQPNMLIAALARRVDVGMNEYAIFAGIEDKSCRYKDYAKALGVDDRCIFLGHVDNTGDVYNSADCLVIASQRESMPLVMLEAMSASKPVVASAVGGIPEVLNDKFAETFRPEQGEDGLCDAMLRLRGRYTAKMGADARRKWAYNYSDNIMAGKYDRLFRGLLS